MRALADVVGVARRRSAPPQLAGQYITEHRCRWHRSRTACKPVSCKHARYAATGAYLSRLISGLAQCHPLSANRYTDRGK